MMAVGPLVPWRHAGRPLWRSLRWPGAAFAVLLMALIAAGVRSLPALLAIPSAFAVASTVLYEYARAVGRWRLAGGGWSRALALVARRRRRYCAFLAHLGLADVVIGLAPSHLSPQDHDLTPPPRPQVANARYTSPYTA